MKAAAHDSAALTQRTIHGVPEGQDARLLAERARGVMAADRVLVHIAQDDARMAALAEMLAFFAPDVEVIQFPAWDCLPYDRVSPGSDAAARRLDAMASMAELREN
ncbi:MAG TPA: hypothetical protein PLO23_00780, partial [Alphaproteobacteria bacterium]|nr:hypothetical protein [Alphaproteobacteria bacterium]